MTARRSAPRPFVLLSAMLTALLAAAVLAGCASVPTGGPVRYSERTVEVESDQFVRVLARPPRDGASPTEVVDGFLAASASFDDDHAVARSYLTAAASRTWVPQSRVRVYDDAQGYRLANLTPSRVSLVAARAAGTISGRGEFRQPLPDTQVRSRYDLKQVDGQWRIAGLAQGLVLSTADIDRAYRSANLYFLDTSGSVLVPNPITLPAGQPGAATALVRELLEGPTPWLAPAVGSAFPAGTSLAVDAVPVEGGVARVDLDTRAVAATGDQRRAMAAQLTYTLVQLPDVSGVSITISGVPFAVPGLGDVSRVEDWESFDPDAPPLDQSAYAVTADGLVTIDAATGPVGGYFGSVRGLTTAAVSHDGGALAGARLESGGFTVRIGRRDEDRAAVAFRGSSVGSLSFDRLDGLWVAGSGGAGGSVWIARRDREPQRIAVRGLGQRRVERVRVSRDGARVALVVAGRSTRTLLLGRVQRDGDVPVIAGLMRIESELADVVDAAWSDDVTLLVVGQRDEAPIDTFSVGIGGDSLRPRGEVLAVRSVAAAPSRPSLAGTELGSLWIDRGNGWRPYLPGRVPVYPG